MTKTEILKLNLQALHNFAIDKASGTNVFRLTFMLVALVKGTACAII